MKSALKLVSDGSPEKDSSFVPSGKELLSPVLISDLFGTEANPNHFNSDGSINQTSYVAWLAKLGEDALRDLENQSVVVTPKVKVQSAPGTVKISAAG